MYVNADFSQRVIVTPKDYAWVASPQRGVERVMLDRIGAEKARATSLVRYAPNSVFPSHAHPAGEEILVLSGTLSEGTDDYPAGWYMRNPPGSAHQPSSAPGATIFVKLRQMTSASALSVRIDTNDVSVWRASPGMATCHLYEDQAEHALLMRLDGAVPVPNVCPAPHDWLVEYLVLAGELYVDGAACPAGSWIRLPAGDSAALRAGGQGVTFYAKTYLTPSVSPEMTA
ncbi:cupin domain-containing protein [Pandoraea pnomenusa]|uniref:cupin domain-containing protein n=1 Tax=Pandoraea pnomenusa TaxID=93220 RepID=UPI00333E8F57